MKKYMIFSIFLSNICFASELKEEQLESKSRREAVSQRAELKKRREKEIEKKQDKKINSSCCLVQ